MGRIEESEGARRGHNVGLPTLISMICMWRVNCIQGKLGRVDGICDQWDQDQNTDRQGSGTPSTFPKQSRQVREQRA